MVDSFSLNQYPVGTSAEIGMIIGHWWSYITIVSVCATDDGCIVRALCFRSMKKNEPPHAIKVSI